MGSSHGVSSGQASRAGSPHTLANRIGTQIPGLAFTCHYVSCSPNEKGEAGGPTNKQRRRDHGRHATREGGWRGACRVSTSRRQKLLDGNRWCNWIAPINHIYSADPPICIGGPADAYIENRWSIHSTRGASTCSRYYDCTTVTVQDNIQPPCGVDLNFHLVSHPSNEENR